MPKAGIPQGRSVPKAAYYRPSPSGMGWDNRQTSFGGFAFLARPALKAVRFCFTKDRQKPPLLPNGAQEQQKVINLRFKKIEKRLCLQSGTVQISARCFCIKILDLEKIFPKGECIWKSSLIFLCSIL